MSFIDCADAELDARVHRMCAPLFATEQFLKQGHDVSTTSATVTFAKFEGRFYGVTCHHVLSAFYAIAIREQRRIIPTIHSGPAIHHIGQVAAHGGYRWEFQSCREFLKPADVDDSEAGAALDRKNSDKPDIAIAELTELWPLLKNFRGAEAIDLDSWIEPDWPATQPVAMAFGYPDDHKYRAGEKIAAPMPRVSAELGNRPSADKPQFALFSTLATAHGWGFSGLSGGPIVIADTIKDRYTVIGITFEGNRAVLYSADAARRAGRPMDALRAWGLEVRARSGHNKAAVAIANKLARILWASWRRQLDFEFRAPRTVTN